MAAPSGIVWGSTVGSYGRIGIYKSLSSTDTTTTVSVEVWFWSKYSVSDTGNTLYFDNLSSSGSASTSKGACSISTTVETGEGWSTSNQKKLWSNTYSYTRQSSAVTRYLYAKLTDVDRVGGTMYASTTFSVPALVSYTVTYNANGGSNAPSSQTKRHDVALTLSSAKPTRSGYAFQGWATSAGGAVTYAAGASYTANASVTLYAVWRANTYTVTYNANGGSGAPSAQTKTYGVNLTLSSTKPTRTNYTFKGWGTAASATTVAYAAGASYTANANVTLYAVWELSYAKPRIVNLNIARCNSSGAASDSGTYALVEFDWACDKDLSSVVIKWKSASASESSTNVSASGTSGSVSQIIGNGELNVESTYNVTIVITDASGYTNVFGTLYGQMFVIDFLSGGLGAAFGKTAELENTVEFAFDAKFNSPVYGKVLGMDRLPEIPANSDFNNYMETGCYAVYRNDIAATCENIPVDRAGRLEVWSSTGEGVRSEQWSYLRQRYITYNSPNPVWEREITRNANNVWTYYDWWQSSLTPAAAKRVYSKAAMSVCLSASVTLGVSKVYTTIPFNANMLSTSNRLTLTDNSIRIGADIQYIKVSGQTLIKCGTVAGNRHVRIQKISGGATTNVSWTTIYSTASNYNIYPLTPTIVSVKEGDLLRMVFYTADTADSNECGSSTNGYQTYMTVEEL